MMLMCQTCDCADQEEAEDDDDLPVSLRCSLVSGLVDLVSFPVWDSQQSFSQQSFLLYPCDIWVNM